MRSGNAGGMKWNLDVQESGGGVYKLHSSEAGSVDDGYSAEDKSNLLYIMEEEKLAGDIYDLFYETWGLTVFASIAKSEDSHHSALLRQAEKIDLDLDEFVLKPAGEYVNEEIQALYDSLAEIGLTSAIAALEVGVLIEQKDITDLEEAADSVADTTLESVYDNLLAGSESHLEAFEGYLIA